MTKAQIPEGSLHTEAKTTSKLSTRGCVTKKKKKKKGKEFVITSSGGFPDSTIGKESTCNARDPSSTPGSVRCTGKGIGYPLQYSWVSLVAQLVKHPPAMQET